MTKEKPEAMNKPQLPRKSSRISYAVSTRQRLMEALVFCFSFFLLILLRSWRVIIEFSKRDLTNCVELLKVCEIIVQATFSSETISPNSQAIRADSAVYNGSGLLPGSYLFWVGYGVYGPGLQLNFFTHTLV